MASKDQGLTVGELTIAISILLIAGLIWSKVNKDEAYDQSLRIDRNKISLIQPNAVPFLTSCLTFFPIISL